eukprot:TRINITY_DN7707_c0_g1_i1.p1 TRINITY_DN7707_c0_g1~~TRINITY_DN7707_c0_g1_i1.p1  ORF type:complete len:334 (+),score=109.31 TRINITY_DN7707_c0_g1_i1:122-1123(+)
MADSDEMSDYSGHEGEAPAVEQDEGPAQGCVDTTNRVSRRTRVMLLPKSAQQAQGPLQIVTLPDPRCGGGRRFAVAAGGTQFLEVRRHARPCAAWFVGSEVVSDGALWVLSPIDPLFVVLRLLHPVAAKAAGEEPRRFRTLDDIYAAGDNPQYREGLAHLRRLTASSIGLICDMHEADGELFARPSVQRAVAWLRCKAAALRGSAVLADWWLRDAAAMHKEGGAAAAGPSDRDMQIQALHLLHDYTPAALFGELCEAEGLPMKEFERAQKSARKSYKELFAERDCDLKRKREAEEEKAQKARMANASMSVKRLAKQGAPKGTQSIMAFFGKKK